MTTPAGLAVRASVVLRRALLGQAWSLTLSRCCTTAHHPLGVLQSLRLLVLRGLPLMPCKQDCIDFLRLLGACTNPLVHWSKLFTFLRPSVIAEMAFAVSDVASGAIDSAVVLPVWSDRLTRCAWPSLELSWLWWLDHRRFDFNRWIDIDLFAWLNLDVFFVELAWALAYRRRSASERLRPPMVLST